MASPTPGGAGRVTQCEASVSQGAEPQRQPYHGLWPSNHHTHRGRLYPQPPFPLPGAHPAGVRLPRAASVAPSGSAAPLCRACWPSCRRRARTCSWTRAARSRSASGPSAPRRSSCRSEGSAREHTPASGCRADSRKLPSCMAADAPAGSVPGLGRWGLSGLNCLHRPVPEVPSPLASPRAGLETDAGPALSSAGGGDIWAR